MKKGETPRLESRSGLACRVPPREQPGCDGVAAIRVWRLFARFTDPKRAGLLPNQDSAYHLMGSHVNHHELSQVEILIEQALKLVRNWNGRYINPTRNEVLLAVET